MLDEDKGKELRELWDEFEAMKSPEALFAASMDRLQPMLSNYNNGGGTWKQFDVPQSEIYKRIDPVRKSSDQLWEFVQEMIESALEQGLISKK